MKHYFLVTIDTEGDSSPHWQMRWPFQTEGVTRGVKEKLTPLFQKYGVRPTYLLAHEILKDEHAMEILRNTPDCELGAHLHWHDPVRFPYYDKMHRHFVQCHFSYAEEYDQMRQLTELFREKTGRQPASFRAGRFGAGPNTGKILTELGYKVDTSVTPHIRHTCPDAGDIADYTDAEEMPHYIREDGNLLYSGTGSLLEVPITVRMRRRYWDQLGVLAKPVPAWLRPQYMKKWELMLMQVMMYLSRKSKVVNLMFHNVEVVPGLSPYSSNEQEAAHYMSTLSAILHLASVLGYEFLTLSEYAEKYAASHPK